MDEEILELALAIVLLVLIVIQLVAVIILARFIWQLTGDIHKLNSRGHTMSFRNSPKDMEIMQKESATPGLFRQLPIWLLEGSNDPKVTESQAKLQPIRIPQNAGGLEVSNSPERERAYTMNISDLR